MPGGESISMRTLNDNAEENAIRKMINDWSDALQRKDVTGVLSHYVPGSVQFLLAPPLQVTDATALGRKGIEEWFSSFDGPIGYEIRDLTVAVDLGTIAFVHSLTRIMGKRTSGEQTDVWFRVTLGLRKIDDKWLIAHEHESVPFHMDGSLRAAVDLKPGGKS